MKRSRKLFGVLFALMLVLFVVPKAQAASSTGYVMSKDFGQSVSAGGYQVKTTNSGLYTKKGNGSWKRIVKGDIMCFTTNGGTIYYASDYLGSFSGASWSTIYTISTAGTNKKKLKRVSGGVCELYRYGNQLIYNSIPLPDGRNVYSYSLTTKKAKKIKSNVSIVHAKKQYLIFQSYGQDFSPRKLTSYNLSTKKLITLASRTQEDKLYFSGDRVYYASWIKSINYGNTNTFQIKSRKFDGSSVKTHTKTFSGGSVNKVTNKYAKYYNTRSQLCTRYYS